MFVLFVMQSYLIEVRGLKQESTGFADLDVCRIL